MKRTLPIMALFLLMAGCSEIEFGTPSTDPLRDTSMTDPAVLLTQKCIQCHDQARIDSARKTRDEWTARIQRCRTYGAQINDVEMKDLGDYLYIRR